MTTIDDVLAKLRKEIGSSVVEQPLSNTVRGVPTGSIALDIALGTGGWPEGYMTTVYGKKGGGKTTLCANSCVHAARNGKRAIFFDLEHKALPELFHGCGLPEDQLVWLRTDTESVAIKVLDTLHEKVDGPLVILARLYSGTLALDILKHVLYNKIATLAVVDSIAGVTSTIEHAKKAQDANVALTARIMSNTLRPLAAPLGLSECALVMTNQIREQIPTGPYRLPRTMPGGWAVKFWSAIMVEINRVNAGKHKQTSIAKIKESCLSIPKTEAEINIVYGKGIDYVNDVFQAAVASKVISTSGGWCKFDGESLGDERKKDAAIKYLRNNPEIVSKIREAVLCNGK